GVRRNRTRAIRVLSALLSLALLFPAAVASQTNSGPCAQVQPIGLDEVHWTRGFWADRFDLCRQKMIPRLWAIMQGTNYSQFYENFRIAAGLAEGRHRG